MKKKDIVTLIQANRTILANQAFVDRTFSCWQKEEIRAIEVPEIEELKEELDILRKEVEEAKEKVEQALEVKKAIPCNHEVRLTTYGGWSREYECVLCGKRTSSAISWEQSDNSNRHFVGLDARYQDDGDDFYEIEDGYTKRDAWKIMLSILEGKEDEDEVDFVEEWKKLDQTRVKIMDQKLVPEYYILIIGGSNSRLFEDGVCITKNTTSKSGEYLHYFLGLLHTKIEVIDQKEVIQKIEKEKFDCGRVSFREYQTIEDLESHMKYHLDIPFKVIIDASELYDYQVGLDSITKTKHLLPLEEWFPESSIVRVESEKEPFDTICQKVKKKIRE